jgi:hypothetical protein
VEDGGEQSTRRILDGKPQNPPAVGSGTLAAFVASKVCPGACHNLAGHMLTFRGILSAFLKKKTVSSPRSGLLVSLKNCLDPGSNQGPHDLQSCALPAELSRRSGK